MKKALRLAALIGAIVMSWSGMVQPVYAITDCSTKDGFACTTPGKRSFCSWYDEGTQTAEIYPCWCDRAFGPLQWRCGPNSCSVDPDSCGFN